MLDAYRAFARCCSQMHLPGFPLRRPIAIGVQLAKLVQLIRRERINTILSSHLGFIPVCSFLRILTGVPAFFHLGLPAANPRWPTKWSFHSLGGGISPAPHTLSTWSAAGWPSSSLWEVPNWVDPDEFHPSLDKASSRAALKIPDGAFCVGFVGRIVPEKGVEVLIQAFNQLRTNADAFLVMVGRGDAEYLQHLRSICRFPESVTILPAVSNVSEILGAFDVSCVPSIWEEPFPLAVMEAMATGLPVICSDVGVLPKILGDEFSGLVAQQGSVSSLVDRLIHVRESWTREQSHRMRCHAVLKYGPSSPVSAYESIMIGNRK